VTLLHITTATDAETAKPLTDLTKKQVSNKIYWTSEHQHAFGLLKQNLCNPTKLHVFEFGKPCGISCRIKFKLCLLMHLIHIGRAPQYLIDCVQPVTISCGRHLRSSETTDYVKRTTRTKFGQRGFSYSGLAGWNGLPPQLRTITNINTVRSDHGTRYATDCVRRLWLTPSRATSIRSVYMHVRVCVCCLVADVTNLVPSCDDRNVTWLPVPWSCGQPEPRLLLVGYKKWSELTCYQFS